MLNTTLTEIRQANKRVQTYSRKLGQAMAELQDYLEQLSDYGINIEINFTQSERGHSDTEERDFT